MNSKVQNLLLQRAQEVRSWAQSKAGRFNQALAEWCAICSAELHRRLSKDGIKTEIHMARSFEGCHVYIVYEDFVLDVTATQFGDFDPVVFKHHKLLEQNWWHQGTDVYLDDEELRRAQIAAGWPKNQVAFKAKSKVKTAA